MELAGYLFGGLILIVAMNFLLLKEFFSDTKFGQLKCRSSNIPARPTKRN